MKKDRSYYSKGIRRKFSSFLFEKDFIKNKGQVKLINKLLGEQSYPISTKFNSHYKAIDYLYSNYKDFLVFEEGIAISEKEGNKNPLTPAVYALHLYNQGGDDGWKQHVEYLKGIAKKQEQEYFWEYTQDLIRFILPAPWMSGISQGIISSLMLRMYHETNEKEYLEIAVGAVQYCLNEKNGLRKNLTHGFWIEEYPSQKGSGVLNGFIFFLIALGELASFGYFEDEFQEGIKALLTNISKYHKGIYLKYASNIPDLCNPWYDKIHYHQLEALYDLTKENVFLRLKKYWKNTSSTNF